MRTTLLATCLTACVVCTVGVRRTVAQDKAPEMPKPEVKSVSLLGAPRGKTTRITVYGENLAPETVALEGKGTPIPVKLVAPAEKTTGEEAKLGSVKVTLELAPPADSAPDVYNLALAGAGNVKVTAPVAIWEPAEQELEIKRPNATYAQAMLLPSTFTAVTGALQNGDNPDVFKFEANAGETFQITAVAGRAGSQADLMVRLRNARHLPLALGGGDEKKDRLIVFRAARAGTYFIEVSDAEGRAGPTFRYRLAIRRLRSTGTNKT